MQGWGNGRRLSSLRMLVSSWRRISSVSAASLSLERLDDLRHVTLSRVSAECLVEPGIEAVSWVGARGGRGAHEQVSILLLKAVQSLRGILCLVLTGVARGQRAEES